MKLQQQPNGQFILTIPKDIVKGFGWRKQDKIEFKIIGIAELSIKKCQQ